MRCIKLVALAFLSTSLFAAAARPSRADPSAERNRPDAPKPVNQHVAKATDISEILEGFVVEKRANVKSVESWNAPRDPCYVLDRGDVTETYKEGDKTWRQTRKRHVTLRPSATVSTADLAVLKGKCVVLHGQHTKGAPYKLEDSVEQVPIGEPVLKRGAGFVVDAIVSDAQVAVPISLNPPIVVKAYDLFDGGASQLLIRDKAGHQFYLFNKPFRQELFLSTQSFAAQPDMRSSVQITKGIPIRETLVAALEQLVKAGHSEEKLEKVKKETEFTKLTEEEKILAGSLYFLAALKTACTRAEAQITVTVSCNKAEYTKDEHIVVSVTLKNVSDRTLTVPNGTLKADGLPRAIDANVRTEDNAIYVPMGLPGPLAPPARRHFAALEPAKTVTVTFEIAARLWHAPGGRLADRAGRYTIRCRFVNKDREYWDPDRKDSKVKPDNMWIGESEWAETKIVFGSGDRAASDPGEEDKVKAMKAILLKHGAKK